MSGGAFGGMTAFMRAGEPRRSEFLPIETYIAQNQLERVLLHPDFGMHITNEATYLLSYLTSGGNLSRLFEFMFVDLAPRQGVEMYYARQGKNCANSVLGLSHQTRTTLATAVADIFPASIRVPGFIERVIQTKGLVIQMLRLIGGEYGEMDKPLPGPRDSTILKCFAKVIDAMISTAARHTLLTTALNNPEGYSALKYWVANIGHTDVADVLRRFIVGHDEMDLARREDLYQLVISAGIVKSLVSILVEKNDSPTSAQAGAAASILTRIVSKNIHTLVYELLPFIPHIATMVFSATPSTLGGLRVKRAGDVVIYAMSWMCYNTALHCQEMSAKLAQAIVHVKEPRKPDIYDTDPIYRMSPSDNPTHLTDVHLRRIDIKFYDIFMQVVAALDRLQSKFSSINTTSYFILEILARLIGITADIRIALYYRKYGEPPANEYSGLDMNAFIINDLNPLTYGYVSPTAHAGNGGPSETPLRKTFLYTLPMGVAYNPITPLEIIKRLCVNRVPERLITLMLANENNTTLHYCCTRILLPMMEFGSSAPSIVEYLVSSAGILRFLRLPIGPFPSYKHRTSLQTYQAMIAQALIRFASGVSDLTAYNYKYLKIEIKGRDEEKDRACIFPTTLDGLEQYASEYPEKCDLALIRSLFSSPELTKYSRQVLTGEGDLTQRFYDNYHNFISSIITQTNVNLDVADPTVLQDVLSSKKLTFAELPSVKARGVRQRDFRTLPISRTVARNSIATSRPTTEALSSLEKEKQRSTTLFSTIDALSDVSYSRQEEGAPPAPRRDSRYDTSQRNPDPMRGLVSSSVTCAAVVAMALADNESTSAPPRRLSEPEPAEKVEEPVKPRFLLSNDRPTTSNATLQGQAAVRLARNLSPRRTLSTQNTPQSAMDLLSRPALLSPTGLADPNGSGKQVAPQTARERIQRERERLQRERELLSQPSGIMSGNPVIKPNTAARTTDRLANLMKELGVKSRGASPRHAEAPSIFNDSSDDFGSAVGRGTAAHSDDRLRPPVAGVPTEMLAGPSTLISNTTRSSPLSMMPKPDPRFNGLRQRLAENATMDEKPLQRGAPASSIRRHSETDLPARNIPIASPADSRSGKLNLRDLGSGPRQQPSQLRPNTPSPSADRFQVYLTGMNSPHPMSMSMELRDVLSSGSQDASVRPTASQQQSLRQMLHKRNPINYFD